MLVLKEPIRTPVPHEDGQWFDFCKLKHTELRSAERAGMVENAKQMEIYSAQYITALTSSAAGSKEKAKEIAAAAKWDPNSYGTDELLRLGIVGWSYAEGEPTEKQLASLDGVTAAWAKQAIIDINKPPTEAEVKKS